MKVVGMWEDHDDSICDWYWILDKGLTDVARV